MCVRIFEMKTSIINCLKHLHATHHGRQLYDRYTIVDRIVVLGQNNFYRQIYDM